MHRGACTVGEVDLATRLRAFHKLPVGVAVWNLRDPKDLRSFRLVGVNPAAEREVRVPMTFAVGKAITDCFPRLLDTPAPEQYRRVILSGQPHTFGELSYQDSRIPAGVFWIDCFPLPDRCVGIALENITERKREVESQTRALQLLHRVTLLLNTAPSVIEGAQLCVDAVCTQFGFPVGRFFLSDEMSPSRFAPNPVWHFSDVRRFRAFRKATELYERDLTNKLALEHRAIHGRKAGLVRSVGFSVVENDFLRGVLEFSSDLSTPIDEHIFRAISNIGFQLGQVFARERLRREYDRVQDLMLSRTPLNAPISRAIYAGGASLPIAAQPLKPLTHASSASAGASETLDETTLQGRHQFADLRRLTAKPIEFPRSPASHGNGANVYK